MVTAGPSLYKEGREGQPPVALVLGGVDPEHIKHQPCLGTWLHSDLGKGESGRS